MGTWNPRDYSSDYKFLTWFERTGQLWLLFMSLLGVLLFGGPLSAQATGWTGHRLQPIISIVNKTVSGSKPVFDQTGATVEGLPYGCGAKDRVCELMQEFFSQLAPPIQNINLDLATRLSSFDFRIDRNGGETAEVEIQFEVMSEEVLRPPAVVHLMGRFLGGGSARLLDQSPPAAPDMPQYTANMACLDLITNDQADQVEGCRQVLVSIFEKSGGVRRVAWIVGRSVRVSSTNIVLITSELGYKEGGPFNPAFELIRIGIGNYSSNPSSVFSFRPLRLYTYQVLGGPSEFLIEYAIASRNEVGRNVDHRFYFSGPLVDLSALPADRAIYLIRKDRPLNLLPRKGYPTRNDYVEDRLVLSQLLDYEGWGNFSALWNFPRNSTSGAVDKMRIEVAITPLDVRHDIVKPFMEGGCRTVACLPSVPLP